MLKCPVCEKELSESIPSSCSICGWDLENDLTLGIFLEKIPKSMIDDYNQRLSKFRRDWFEQSKRQSQHCGEQDTNLLNLNLSKKSKEHILKTYSKSIFKNFNNLLRKGTNVFKKDYAERKNSSIKIIDKEKNKSEELYSRNASITDVNRDSFETIKEYEKRINDYPALYGGEAELIKEEYDIKTGYLPLKFQCKKWAHEILKSAGRFPSVKVKPEIAKAIYNSAHRHPIFVKLRANGEHLSIMTVFIASSISNIEIIFKNDIKTKEWIDPITGMVFVHVPAGKFRMGSNNGSENEKPVHDVELDEFYLGKYPVTQEQWMKVREKNPSYFLGGSYPVEQVSWNDAILFIENLKDMNSGHYDFALPTEAQWEYAARCRGRYDLFSGGEDLDNLSWYSVNSNGSTHPVGQKYPNGLGIYDMSGNIWEWCQDDYDFDAYSRHAKKNPVNCNMNNRDNSYRVIRGGSWRNDKERLRCTERNSLPPAYRSNRVGFRLIKKPEYKKKRERDESFFTDTKVEIKLKYESNDFSDTVSDIIVDRDVFEEIKKYEERINALPPVYAGEATLIKDEYNIENSIFPLKIKWIKWVQDIVGISDMSSYVKAERDIAKKLYNCGPKHPIFIQLKARGEHLSAGKITLAFYESVTVNQEN